MQKAQETQSYQRFQHIVHTVFNTSGTNAPHSLSRANVGTHSAFGEGSHTRAHTPKQGPSGQGRYHYPRHVLHVHEHPRAGCQNGVLCRFGILAGRCSRRTQKAFGTAMRLCASLSQGVAAPLGCVIFFPLSKLRLLRPIPETSFGFPDAPACAVPVQAASRLVPQRTLSAFQTESNPSDYTEVIN